MPHLTIRCRTLILGAVTTLAVVMAGATGADATVIRPAAEPQSGLVLTLDNGAAKISSGTSVTYRATLTNRGHRDLTNLRVTINVSGPFSITEAVGGKVRRSTVAQWVAAVPAGRVVHFALRGTFDAIPPATKAVTATGCVFVLGHTGPLVCNSALSGVVDAPGSSGWTVADLVWTVSSAVLSLAVVVILLLAVLRRGRRTAAGTDS
jgi:hypothetical protein